MELHTKEMHYCTSLHCLFEEQGGSECGKQRTAHRFSTGTISYRKSKIVISLVL